MSARVLISAFVVLSAIASRGVGHEASELKVLYDAHRWNDLYVRVQNTSNAPTLYRGAVGVAFNQDPEKSERLLLSLISADPQSTEAYDASEWLSHLYLYRGQYHSLAVTMERRWAAFPEKKERTQEQADLAGFRGLPDQIIESSRPSTLKHEPGSIFIPLSINDGSATYFFDTGAWISCMSESEASRLHLVIRNTSGTMGQSAGSKVGFRTAVAADVIIGETHFKDVSFAVFRTTRSPGSVCQWGAKELLGCRCWSG